MPKAGGAADGPSVLFIEGFTRAGDSYVNGLLSQQGAWRGTAIDRITCIGDQQLWPEAMDACRLAIASGAYHALVIVDLSAQIEAFEADLGLVIMKFAQSGGAVAFTSREGFSLPPTLSRLFGTSWTSSHYYRAKWSITAKNSARVAATFGIVDGDGGGRDGVPLSTSEARFSLKACSLRGVPGHEACFGANRKAGPTATEYDVCIATRDVGDGSICFFGDVCPQPITARLVASYVHCAAGRRGGPVAAWELGSRLVLESSKFEAAMRAKEAGNDAFGASRFDEALARYDEALEFYGESLGESKQRDEKTKLCSNRAECLLKLRRWREAAAAADDALAISPAHEKSLLRRARARMEMEDFANDDEGDHLRLAIGDLERVAAGRAGDAVSTAKRLLLAAREREKKLGDGAGSRGRANDFFGAGGSVGYGAAAGGEDADDDMDVSEGEESDGDAPDTDGDFESDFRDQELLRKFRMNV